MRYKSLTMNEDGWSEWEDPIMQGYRLSCCDCSLVHEFEFRVTKKREVEFRLKRNNRATAQLRRQAEKARAL